MLGRCVLGTSWGVSYPSERGAEKSGRGPSCVENTKCCELELCSKCRCALSALPAGVEAGRAAAEAAGLGWSSGTAAMPGAPGALRAALPVRYTSVLAWAAGWETLQNDLHS